jgi:hypothetical protein
LIPDSKDVKEVHVEEEIYTQEYLWRSAKKSLPNWKPSRGKRASPTPDGKETPIVRDIASHGKLRSTGHVTLMKEGSTRFMMKHDWDHYISFSAAVKEAQAYHLTER